MHQIRPSLAGRPARLFLVLLLIGTLAACGSAASGALSGDAAAPSAAAAYGDPSTPGRTIAESPGGAPVPSAAPSGGPDALGSVDDAKIVRTGTMDLEVSDVTKAVAAARDAIRGFGGYVGASKTSNDGDRPVASVTYRIPSDRWEEALGALRSLNGLTTKVVVEQTEAVEVTGQIVDLDARIRNLQASEIALQGIAAKAAKVSDVLEVQSQLTDVRGQIEELSAQRKDLGDRADYGTLTTSFKIPLVAVEVAKKGWEPTTIVDSAAASMVGILQGLAGAGIWFVIVWLPILIVVSILALVGSAVIRRTGVLRRMDPPAPPAGPPAGPADPLAVG